MAFNRERWDRKGGERRAKRVREESKKRKGRGGGDRQGEKLLHQTEQA